jgi:glucose-6-phosphate 1-dehydrogenase
VTRVWTCSADCSSHMEAFLEDVSYVPGQYDERDCYRHLDDVLSVRVRAVCCVLCAVPCAPL